MLYGLGLIIILTIIVTPGVAGVLGYGLVTGIVYVLVLIMEYLLHECYTLLETIIVNSVQ